MKKYRLGSEQRQHSWQEAEVIRSVMLRQIIALRDFADVSAGTPGGWVEDETNLDQSGHCWIYNENSMVFAGASISGNARLTQSCMISQDARISDNAWIDGADISQGACVSGNATVQCSQVSGDCHIFGNARVLNQSQVYGVKGLTHCDDDELRIYGDATVSASRVVHQAQIYGHARVSYAFIEHRARIYDNALLEGNALNNVWVCDCAAVYGNAHILAGLQIDAIPTLRYGAQVFDNARVEGDCLLKQQVRVSGNALLRGGPLLLDEGAQVCGQARVEGRIMLQGEVHICEDASLVACGEETLCIQGPKVINGHECLTRSPLFGLL